MARKRASMREGPLAALFQSTIDEEKEAQPADDGVTSGEGGSSPPITPSPADSGVEAGSQRKPRDEPVLPPEPEDRDEPRVYVNERPADPAPAERVAAEVNVSSPPR